MRAVRLQASGGHRPCRAVFMFALLASGLAGLGGCSAPPAPAFDLTAPGAPGRHGPLAGRQVVVPEPSAIQPFEAQLIVARDAANSISYLPGAQWADRLPRLVQARLVQTFENASAVRASRPAEGVVGDYQLNSAIRAFQLDGPRSEALVEMSVNLVDLKSGKLVSSRIVSRRVPVADSSGPAVAQALDRALSGVMLDIVRWVGGGR